MKQNTEVKPSHYTDIEYIKGLEDKDPRIEKNFYNHCKRYFYEHYKSVFFSNEVAMEDIFQNSFISLWQSIDSHKIHLENNVVVGKNNKPLGCMLTTYLMSIARNKYLELARSCNSDGCLINLPTDDRLCGEHFIDDWLEDDYEKSMFEVISDSLSMLPQSCSDILRKFYYENKKLDDMLCEFPSYTSKDALKSNKNRCLGRLKTFAQQLYKIRKEKQ